MDSSGGKPDVLDKIDALLTRHRNALPAQQDLSKQADREAIPVLTEIVGEGGAIPVLTEAVANEAGTDDDAAGQTGAGGQAADIPDDEALRRIEEFMVSELESRIALEFTATLERALGELLDRSREHIRHAVREALRQRPGTPPRDTDDGPDQP